MITAYPDDLLTLYVNAVDNKHLRAEIFGLDNVQPDSFDSGALDLAVRYFSQRLLLAGIKPGACVLYQGHQSVDALICFWATVLIGGIFAPVDPEWPPYLGLKALNKAKPALILADPEYMAFWRENASTPVLCTAEAASGAGSHASAPPQIPSAPPSPSSIAAYLFTSGSTGDPKAVMLSHAALANSAALAARTFDWRPGETLVNLAEPHTMSGLRNGFVAAPLAGITWSIRPAEARESIFSLVDFLTHSQPHRLVAAPVLLRHINLLGERFDNTALQRLKAFYCTGADLRNEDVRTFFQRHHIPVINYYGLTETVGLCLCQSLADWTPEDDSLGMVVGCESQIDDKASPIEGVGELRIKQHNPMSGYLGDPDATTLRFDGAWLKTGDLVSQDADGRVHLVGRKDSFIKTAGTDRLYPQEVETVLESYHSVLEAACLGVPDSAGTERVTALVVVYDAEEDPVALTRTLHEFTRQHLGNGRAPTQIRIVKTLPRTSNGKLQRNKLKDFLDAN